MYEVLGSSNMYKYGFGLRYCNIPGNYPVTVNSKPSLVWKPHKGYFTNGVDPNQTP